MKLFSTLCLLWSLAEVHSEQTFPYVSFMGQTLANHSYVDLSLVGNVSVSSVQCITDLQSCCSNGQGAHRGSWFFPYGTRLPFEGDIHLVQRRGLIYVVLLLLHRLEYIAVLLRLLRYMMIVTRQLRKQSMLEFMALEVYSSLFTKACSLFVTHQQEISKFIGTFSSLFMTVTSSHYPVSLLVDLLPLSLGPEIPPL